MFVIPKNGLTVIDPALRDALPPEGRDVREDFPNYWLRHFQEGSIQIVAEDKVEAAKAKADKAISDRAALSAKAAADALIARPTAEAPKPAEIKK